MCIRKDGGHTMGLGWLLMERARGPIDGRDAKAKGDSFSSALDMDRWINPDSTIITTSRSDNKDPCGSIRRYLGRAHGDVVNS
ncbi:hypothetical protein V6N11_049296 [Hibiscus sabdariffa]|uniref:Uncharacterized protein n=2 Tax=Hibiscus sabdariffa TaxID=183260 RepID=A0ABR2P0C1_9ROSI